MIEAGKSKAEAIPRVPPAETVRNEARLEPKTGRHDARDTADRTPAPLLQAPLSEDLSLRKSFHRHHVLPPIEPRAQSAVSEIEDPPRSLQLPPVATPASASSRVQTASDLSSDDSQASSNFLLPAWRKPRVSESVRSSRLHTSRRSQTRDHSTVNLERQELVKFLLDQSNLEAFDNVLFHQSDSFVSQIAGNQKIERWPSVSFDYETKYMGFQAYPAQQWNDLPFDVFTAHLASIQLCFDSREGSRNSSRSSSRPSSRDTTSFQSEKLRGHVLNYLYDVASANHVANALVNSSVFPLLVRALRVVYSDSMRIKLARVISLCVKEATLISETVNMSDIIASLVDFLREYFRITTVRRSLMAALGEALFYVASQNATKQTWLIPNSVYALIFRVMTSDDDSVAQQYAVKCIENLASLHGDCSHKFATNEVIMSLWQLFGQTAVVSFRSSCILALCRLTYISPTLLQVLADKVTAKTLFGVLSDANARTRQALVTSLLIILLDANRLRNSLSEDPHVISRILEYFESSPVHLRGKYYLLIAALAERNPTRLLEVARSQFFLHLERDAERAWLAGDEHADENTYLLACCHRLISVVLGSVSPILLELSTHLPSIAGRKHPSSQQIKALRPSVQTFPLILHSLQCQVLHQCILASVDLANFAGLFEYLPGILARTTNLEDIVESSSQDFPMTCFEAMTVLCASSEFVQRHFSQLCTQVLPVCASLWSMEIDANLKLLAAQTVAGALQTYSLTDSHDVNARSRVNVTFGSLIGPLESLFREDDPFPALAASIATSMIAISRDFVPILQQAGLCEIFIRSFHTVDTDDNVDTRQMVCLVRELLRSPLLDLAPLMPAGLVERIVGALATSATSLESVDDFLLPLLEALYALLKGVTAQVRLALQHPAESQAAEFLLQSCRSLMRSFDTVHILVLHEDMRVALNAMRCLTTLLQLYTEESAILFSPLSLQTLHHALTSKSTLITRLALKLMLQALAYAPQCARHIAGDAALSMLLKDLVSGPESADSGSLPDLSESLRLLADSTTPVHTSDLARQVLAKSAR
eukprot:m.160221 g.160221  ORF g.160221 m.160221 type:complete len:1054 (+) comp53025_c0_seq2:388-3549(+)